MRLVFGLIIASPLVALGACTADPPFPDETDGVITVSSKGFHLGDYESYITGTALEELCVQSESESNDPQPRAVDEPKCAEIDHGQDLKLLARIHQNLEERSITRLGDDKAEKADLLLLPGIVASDFWDLSETFCIDTKTSKGCIEPLTSDEVLAPVGSLVVILVDLNKSREKELKAVWMASIDQRWAAGSALGVPSSGGGAGGAGGSGPSSDDRIEVGAWLDGIDVAFAQSIGKEEEE